jgi:hypothetical protein
MPLNPSPDLMAQLAALASALRKPKIEADALYPPQPQDNDPLSTLPPDRGMKRKKQSPEPPPPETHKFWPPPRQMNDKETL